MIGFVLVLVIGFSSWYFDHYRKRVTRLNELGASVGVRRLPGEANDAYENRIGARCVIRGPFR